MDTEVATIGINAESHVTSIAIGSAVSTEYGEKRCANFTKCRRWLLVSKPSMYCPDCNIIETHKETMQALAELADQVRSLARTVEELKYAPGLTGYVEARDQFAEDVKKLK